MLLRNNQLHSVFEDKEFYIFITWWLTEVAFLSFVDWAALLDAGGAGFWSSTSNSSSIFFMSSLTAGAFLGAEDFDDFAGGGGISSRALSRSMMMEDFEVAFQKKITVKKMQQGIQVKM